MNRQYNKVKLNEMFGVDQNAVTAEIPQVKKRKKHKKRTVFDYVTGIIVELCLVTSILIAGFLGWQLFWTSYQVSGEVDQAITDVKAAYQDALKAPNRLLTPAVPSVCLPAPAAS